MKAARLSTTRTAASFQPAAVAPAERPVYIFPYGPGYYGVVGVQTNAPGGTLEFVRSPVIEVPLSGWASMSTPFWVAQGETMMVQIPYWADQNFFVDVKSVQGVPPAFAPAAVAVATGKTVKVRGKTFKMIRVSLDNAPFEVFKLTP